MIATSSAVISHKPKPLRDKLLSTGIVAGRLCVSERTVRRLCETGQIRAGQVGTQWRIPESAYRAYYQRVFGLVEPEVTYRRH